MKQVYRDIVIESLKFCQKEKGLEIFSWVIMSNHVHLLARSSRDDLSGTIIQTKVRYIHDNPVRAGVVINPEDYKYSSAGAYSGREGLIDIIPIVITIEKIR